MQDQDVNVEYMYAFFTTVEGNAVVVFRVADDRIGRVAEVLSAGGVPILKAADVYGL
jgi:hypothetical protein